MVEDDPVDREVLHTKNNMVSFFCAHFEVGLQLSLDPFIYEFMEEVSAAPIDLNLHDVRLFICFAIVCSHLGFEPCASTFLEFFSIQCSGPKHY